LGLDDVDAVFSGIGDAFCGITGKIHEQILRAKKGIKTIHRLTREDKALGENPSHGDVPSTTDSLAEPHTVW
jgi:hypothetical protein